MYMYTDEEKVLIDIFLLSGYGKIKISQSCVYLHVPFWIVCKQGQIYHGYLDPTLHRMQMYIILCGLNVLVFCILPDLLSPQYQPPPLSFPLFILIDHFITEAHYLIYELISKLCRSQSQYIASYRLARLWQIPI